MKILVNRFPFREYSRFEPVSRLENGRPIDCLVLRELTKEEMNIRGNVLTPPGATHDLDEGKKRGVAKTPIEEDAFIFWN